VVVAVSLADEVVMVVLHEGDLAAVVVEEEIHTNQGIAPLLASCVAKQITLFLSAIRGLISRTWGKRSL
jgi:hypothetical protein